MMNVRSQSNVIASPEATVPDNLEILAQTAASQASDLHGLHHSLQHSTHLPFPVLRIGEHVGLPLLGHPQIRIEGQPGGPMLSQAQLQKILGGGSDSDKGVSPGPLSIVAATFGDPGQPSPAAPGAGDAMLSAINYNDNEILQEGGFDVSSNLGGLDDGLLGNPVNLRLSESSTSHSFDLFDGEGDSLNMESLSPSGLIMSDAGLGSVTSESSVGDLTGESGSHLKEEKKKQKVRSKPSKTVPIAGKVGALECDLCRKVFTNTSALAKHKLTHSEERKYLCTVCNKKFKRQDHLNGHLMTHRDKKPYQCTVEVCEKSYCDARSLRRHFENHHQFNPDQIASSMMLASSSAAEILAEVSNSIPTQPTQQSQQTSPAGSAAVVESVGIILSNSALGITAKNTPSVSPEKAMHVMPSTVVTTATAVAAKAESGAVQQTPSSFLAYEQLMHEQRQEQEQQQAQLQIIRHIQQIKQEESAQKQQQQQPSGGTWQEQGSSVHWPDQSTSYQQVQDLRSPSSHSQSPNKDSSSDYQAMSPSSPSMGMTQPVGSSPIRSPCWYSVPTPPQAEAGIQTTQANMDPVKAEELAKPVVCSICQRRFKNVPALNGHMRLHGGYFKKESALKEERRKKVEMVAPYNAPAKSSHNSPSSSALPPPLEMAPQTSGVGHAATNKGKRRSPFQSVQSPPQDNQSTGVEAQQQQLQMQALQWMEAHKQEQDLQQTLQMAQQQAQLQLLQITASQQAQQTTGSQQTQQQQIQSTGNPGQSQLSQMGNGAQQQNRNNAHSQQQQLQQMVDTSQQQQGNDNQTQTQQQQQIAVMDTIQHLPQLDIEQLQQLRATALGHLQQQNPGLGQHQLQNATICHLQPQLASLGQQQLQNSSLGQQQQQINSSTVQQQQQMQNTALDQQQLQQLKQQKMAEQQIHLQLQQQQEHQQQLMDEQKQKLLEDKQHQFRQQQKLLQQQQFEQQQQQQQQQNFLEQQRQAMLGRHNPSYMAGSAPSPHVPQSPGTPNMPQSPMVGQPQYVAHSPMLQRQGSVDSVKSPVNMNQPGLQMDLSHEFSGLPEGVDTDLLNTIRSQLHSHNNIHSVVVTQVPTTAVQTVNFNSVQGLPVRYGQVNPSVNIHHNVSSSNPQIPNTFVTTQLFTQVTSPAKSSSNEIVSQIVSDLQSAEENIHIAAMQSNESIDAQAGFIVEHVDTGFNRDLSSAVLNKTTFNELSHNPHTHVSHISLHNPQSGHHISHNPSNSSEGQSSSNVKQELLKHLAAKPLSPRAAPSGTQFLFQNNTNGRQVTGEHATMESPLSPIQQQNTELTRRLSAGLDDFGPSSLSGSLGVHSGTNKEVMGTYVKPAPIDCDTPVRLRMRSQSGEFGSETVRPRLRSKSGDHHLHQWVSEDHTFMRPKLRTEEAHRPRSKTDEHLAKWTNQEILSKSDGAGVFRNPSYFPSSFKIKRKNRPAPLIIPPYANHGGFQSRLRSPRIWHDGVDLNHSASVPYTPPPMLSPLRRGSGLFRSMYGSLTPIPASATLLVRSASVGEAEPTVSDLATAPETDTQPHVNVGPQYQPVVPNYNSNRSMAQFTESKEDLLWDPRCVTDLTEEDVQCYQELACCAAVQGNGSNVEHALHLLHLAAGDTQKAMLMLMRGDANLPPNHSLTSYIYQESEVWSGADVENYVQALFKHDKDFFNLAGEMKTKSVKQCIQFYYVWKKAMPEDHKRLRMMRRKREQLYNLRSRQPTQQQQQTTAQQRGSGDSETTEPAVDEKPDFDDEDDDETESSTTCGTGDDQNEDKEYENDIPELPLLYDSPAPSSNPSPIPAFPCDYPECNSSFSSKPALNAHLKIHVRARRSPSPARPVVHAPNPITSNKAPDKGGSLGPISQTQSPARNGDDPVFACKVCGRVFAKVKSRSAHMKIHRPDQDKKPSKVTVKPPPRPHPPQHPQQLVVDNFQYTL